MAILVKEPTIELRNFTTLRNTKSNFAQLTQMTLNLENMATSAPSLIMLMRL